MRGVTTGEEGDEADDVKSIATLMSGDTFKRVMADIEKYQEQNEQHEILGDIEDEPEYKLIVETNALSTEMDSEIALIHKFTRDNCGCRALRPRARSSARPRPRAAVPRVTPPPCILQVRYTLYTH